MSACEVAELTVGPSSAPIVPRGLASSEFLRAMAVSFCFFLSLNAFNLLPLHVVALGGTAAAVGLVMGAFSVAGIVVQPLVGPWTDALGRRPFMLGGIAVVLAAELLAVPARSVGTLTGVRALQGLGFSAFFVANFSYAMDVVPSGARGRALGLYGVSGLLATALAPLAGEVLARRAGFPVLFVASAAVAAVALALAWRMPERRPLAVRLGQALEWPRLDAGLPGPRGRRADGRTLLGVTLVFGLGQGTTFAFVPTYAASLGVGAVGVFYTAYACAAIGVRLGAGGLADTRGRRAVALPALGTQALGALLLAVLGFAADLGVVVAPLPVVVAVGLVAGGAHGFLYPALAAMVGDRAPAEQRGAAVGLFSATFLCGSAAGAIGAGWVVARAGYVPMWGGLAGVLAAGVVLGLGLPDDRPTPRDSP